jgi:biopolymer transport protein ExbD
MKLSLQTHDDEGPSMTPIIDMVFLLLIFFLVATRFDEEEREIGTRLAEVAQAQPQSQPPNEVVINISEKGDFVVIGERLSEKQLSGFLTTLAVKNPGTQTVQIRTDERVPFRYPARVMGLCEREKIEHYFTVVVPEE